MRNYSLARAVQTTVLHYLANGNFRPLFYLTWRGYVPGPRVRRHVAALLTKDAPVYYVGFQPGRGRRSSKEKKANARERQPVLDRLTAGKYVSHKFWDYLSAALYEDYRPALQQKYKLPKSVSLKAKLEYKSRSRANAGEHEDLDLVPRDRRLMQLLQDRIDREEPVDNAREDVVTDWNVAVADAYRIKGATLKKKQTPYEVHKAPRVSKPRRPPSATRKASKPEGKISPWSTEKGGVLKRTKTGD
jgi:hypothetical protein